MRWKTLSTRIAYDNPYTYVEESTVVNPAGEKTVYGVMKSKADGVYIVPVDDEGNTYLTQQYRYTTKQISWEVASGRVDEGDFLAAAKRELHEETGILAKDFVELGSITPANGICAFNERIFLAQGLTITDDELDQADGIIDRKKLTLDDAIMMAMSGELHCPQSIAALFMAREYLSTRGGRNEF